MEQMREYIVAACAMQFRSENDFENAVQHAGAVISKRVLVADTPPPKRQVRLIVDLLKVDHITTRSVKNIYGLAYNKDYFLQELNIKIDSISEIDGLVSRIVSENGNISYYGIKVILFTSGIKKDASVKIYGYFKDWSRRLSNETGVEVTFDLASSKKELEFILNNEHRRMVYGDIKAQWAAVKKAL